MSPNRLEATTTSKRSGCSTNCARQDVDVVLVPGRPGTLGHRRTRSSQYGMVIAMPLRLGRRGQVLLRTALGQLEGVAQDAVDAGARHHRFLHDDLALGAVEDAPADAGILALGVLAHDVEVDVARLALPRAATGIPGISGHGRRFTYWSNSRRNWSSDPHSEI